MFPSEISFSTPEWLINIYHANTVLSFSINLLGIYLIMFHSGKIDNFKYFLLWFTICCLASDFFMFFLMQPIPLTPIWAGYINGPFRSVFGLSCHNSSVTHDLNYCFQYGFQTIVGFVIGQQFAALTMCFVRKYQAISKIDSSNSISNKEVVAVSVFTQVMVTFWLILYHFTSVNGSVAMGIIQKVYSILLFFPKTRNLQEYPEYLDRFLELEDFALYLLDRTTLCCMIMAGLCASIFAIIIVFSTVEMLKLLTNLEQQVSLSHLKRHRSAVTSLVAQFLTSAVAIIPPVGCGILLFLEFRYVQVSVWIMLAVFSCHGVLNCLVMILTYPPYRSRVKGAFWSSKSTQPSN